MFDPRRHVALSPDAWNDGVAREAVREIVEDALDRFDPDGFWPTHPLDDGAPEPSTSVYFGAAGVFWALDHLRRAGAVEFEHDFRGLLPRLLTLNREEFAATAYYPRHASLLLGDVGVLLLTLKVVPNPTLADVLFERVGANDTLPVLELLWGTPGTMLACVMMEALTGEKRWIEAYRKQACRLLDDLAESEFGRLWVQDLYGRPARYLGFAHGYAGNMAVLLQGWHWLASEQRARIAAAVPETLSATAQEAEHGVNWPAVAGRDAVYLVQICHGAPGLIAAFAACPFSTPELERLLLLGGELIWHAGPVAKGSNFCHGTAGNGYALLRLHKRTRDAVWLERARAFAMTAIAQCRVARRQYGQGRYSLWTGDLGLACYLWDCVMTEPRFPTVDAR